MAQKSVTLYFDKEGKETQKKETASYYRVGYPDSSGLWKATDYYMSNKIRMTGTFSSRELNSWHGYFIQYHENGKKKFEGRYINNLQEGNWQFWFENGQKQAEGRMVIGRREGSWAYWHQNGVKNGEGNFSADKHDGSWSYWHDNGEKKSKGNYVLGAKSGLWRYWNERGVLDCEEIMNHGNIISLECYHENGNPKVKGYYSNNKKSDVWTYWNVDGRKYWSGRYINDMIDGKWVRYLKNGDSLTVIFEKGKKKGEPLGSIYRPE
jgi:antitoxin component YwqK of YwqJK toxin-antitoxin module